MANPYEVKIGIIEKITGTLLFQPIPISDESKVRVVIANTNGSNEIVISARINGQDDWDVLSTITGDDKSTIDVSTYDELQIECTIYDSASSFVKVIVSSFNIAGGSTSVSIDAPAGGTVSGSALVFTSSDNSVTITADPGTSTIDFIATGSGGLSKFTQTFNNTSDWTLNAGNYEYTILAATYGSKANPVVHTFETTAGTDTVISHTIIKNASNNIILQVTQVPDNRYTGKIIIL